ncbi:Imm50 family immunity protein [Streptomyces niveiscabiei]|uniref:Imm50 family immunity protein n=1 Tax=Streptomyces niveiscabiei TaxID=164115 RepID=UPI0029B8F0DF|nr:Imm50 family immunity protein [Streptomyces niveiscabiei]MDX3385737.1 Imm50 family immunity protein [Streptomyces niveiscabiei]
MSVSDWGRILGSSDALGALYGDSVPMPEECELYYVHVDERGSSVTVGFETRNVPSRPGEAWRDKVYNTLEFYLLFSGVREFSVNRWSSAEAERFDVAIEVDGGVAVVLGGEGSGIRFRADSVGLPKVRVYLAAAEVE